MRRLRCTLQQRANHGRGTTKWFCLCSFHYVDDSADTDAFLSVAHLLPCFSQTCTSCSSQERGISSQELKTDPQHPKINLNDQEGNWTGQLEDRKTVIWRCCSSKATCSLVLHYLCVYSCTHTLERVHLTYCTVLYKKIQKIFSDYIFWKWFWLLSDSA